MARSRIFYVAAALLITAGFAYGVGRLFELRFESGTIYPPYSTLRTDPLGTSAFFEGLNRTGGISASRNVDEISKTEGAPGRTLFILGADPSDFSLRNKPFNKALNDFASDGGRLVIAFAPVKFAGKKPEEDAEDYKADKPEKDKNKEGQCMITDAPVSIFGADLKTERFATKEPKAYASMAVPGLPSIISWYSALCFDPDDSNWRTIYTRDGFPVVIERRLGKGSVVLCSDSYFISNEAMKKERHASLLTWLEGNSTAGVFDETHLGISRDPGVATLIRRYNLMPFAASLILLAFLFIWKNATSLVPRDNDTGSSNVDWGKDSASALTNLYRRNIKPAYLIDVCVKEYRRSFTHGGRIRPEVLSEIDRFMEESGKPGRKASPVQMYRKLSSIISGKGDTSGPEDPKGDGNV